VPVERDQAGRPRSGTTQPQEQNLEELSLEDVEGVLIRKALQRFHGNVSQRRKRWRSRGALYRRMENMGFSPRAEEKKSGCSMREK